MNYFTPKRTSIIISFLCLSVIALIIITQSTSLALYDENNFLPNIHFLQQFGFTRKFLLNMTGSPGPTYAVLHYLFINFTHYNILYIRLTNFILLFPLLFFIYLNARLLNAENPEIITANFIVVPMVWVSCGLALTEIPAMLFAVISLYFFLQCFIVYHKPIFRLIFSVLGGISLSFAILGRTFFLMVIVAIPICILFSVLLSFFDRGFKIANADLTWKLPNKTQSLILLICFFIFSGLLPLETFMTWRALAPPQDSAYVGANNVSLVPWYCVLSFCYCGFITLILAPNWFVIKKKLLIISLVVSIAFLCLNIYRGYFTFAPFLSAAIKFLPPDIFNIYQRIIPALIFLCAFHFILTTVIKLWQNRYNSVFLFLGLVIILIAFSAIKVKAQFSSRYVAQITPYFLLIFIPFERTDWQKVLRVSVGAALGFISLYFYYHST